MLSLIVLFINAPPPKAITELLSLSDFNTSFSSSNLKNFSPFFLKISEIFKRKGEEFFRLEEEKEVLKSLKASNSVIALGGGAFINKTIRNNVLKNAISIWLDADLKDLNKRIKWSNKRPLLSKENSQKKINKLYDKRKNIYKLANHRINCDKLSKENITKKIIIFYEKY